MGKPNRTELLFGTYIEFLMEHETELHEEFNQIVKKDGPIHIFSSLYFIQIAENLLERKIMPQTDFSKIYDALLAYNIWLEEHWSNLQQCWTNEPKKTFGTANWFIFPAFAFHCIIAKDKKMIQEILSDAIES